MQENEYDLTLICPGIRNENWVKSYESIDKAFSGSYEVIFVGPYELPEELKNIENIKWIKSLRSPIASQQIGLVNAKGKYISWFSDDGQYLPSSLDEAFKIVEGENYKVVVTGKYLEGDTPVNMETNYYYTLSHHESMKLPNVPKDAMMLNCGIISRQLLNELGGWDCYRFEVCPIAYNDLAIRAYKYGAKFIIQSKLMFKCSHMPGHTGDHGPIHDGQTMNDEPVFKGLYSAPNYERIKIELDNWKATDEIWARRFAR